jgi:hypothetical protein
LCWWVELDVSNRPTTAELRSRPMTTQEQQAELAVGEDTAVNVYVRPRAGE